MIATEDLLMAQIRNWIDSSVRRLAARLEDLGDMLATIHLKLHDAIADAVSRTISTVAHDALLAVLDRIAPPGIDAAHERGRLMRDDRRFGSGYDRHDDDDLNWNESDEEDGDHRASAFERQRSMGFVGAAGLQVGAWVLTRLSDRHRLGTAAIATALLACSGLFSPVFAIVGVGMLLSACRINLLTDLLRSLAST
jgi:hypothetical protein